MNCICPLTAAVLNGPNLLAFSSSNCSFTFKEFDRYVNALEFESIIEGHLDIKSIAMIFKAIKERRSLFILNPKLPNFKNLKKNTIHFPENSLLILTSGSTAVPKIAVLPWQKLIINALGVIKKIDLNIGDEWYLTLPIFHVGGVSAIIRSFLSMATISLTPTLNMTHTSCVPTQLYRALPLVKKLKCILLGGAPIHSYPEHLPIFVTYGLTEMCSTVTLQKTPQLPYLGHPLENRELKIGNDGEILVSGKCLFDGYLNEEKQHGWFHTKDIGSYDEKLGLIVKGRKDWQFISGGENIQPEEIEMHLSKMPGIDECVIVPIDDPEFGKKSAAVLVTKQTITLTDIQSYLSDFLPKYKLPVKIYLMNEIPKKGIKINRNQIIDLIGSQ